MKRSKNLQSITLAGSGVAALGGCEDFGGEVRVERPGTEGIKAMEALYDVALYSGMALCGMYILYKWCKKDL